MRADRNVRSCRHTEFHIWSAGRNDFSPPTNLAAETFVSESYNVLSRTRETIRSALLCSSRSTCLLVLLITGSGTMAMTLAAAFGVRSSRAAQGARSRDGRLMLGSRSQLQRTDTSTVWEIMCLCVTVRVQHVLFQTSMLLQSLACWERCWRSC